MNAKRKTRTTAWKKLHKGQVRGVHHEPTKLHPRDLARSMARAWNGGKWPGDRWAEDARAQVKRVTAGKGASE